MNWIIVGILIAIGLSIGSYLPRRAVAVLLGLVGGAVGLLLGLILLTTGMAPEAIWLSVVAGAWLAYWYYMRASREDRSDLPRLAGRTILVIESEPPVARLSREILEVRGARVVELSKKERFPSSLKLDGAVVDAHLSGDKSVAVANVLKEHGIPLVVLTRHDVNSIPVAMRDHPSVLKSKLWVQLPSLALAQFSGDGR
jgi:hypothetical protein